MDNYPTVTLQRYDETPKGTFGFLEYLDNTLCNTLEEMWRNNQHKISCIPDGKYLCTKHDSEKHPQSWEVNGVPNRQSILIHTGNTLADTEGCILVGMSTNDNGVVSSRVAMTKLKATLPDTFWLEVKNGN